MSVLLAATNQWSSRPADERYKSLDELHRAVLHHREISVEASGVDLRTFKAAVGINDRDGNLRGIVNRENSVGAGETVEPVIVGESGKVATFTHYSFGQIARRLGAPASYLRELPPALAVANLNNGISRLDPSVASGNSLLFSQNGGLRLRAALSGKYTRIWNSDITSRLIRLTQQRPEWQPAPAAFDGSRGLYASDRDLFAFMVDSDRPIFETLPGGGLGRGFFVSNSEVGDASFAITTFLYEYICGNHRVWGAQGVQTIRIPHIGNADERAFRNLTIELTKYANGSTTAIELQIEAQRKFTLGATKDEVLDKVFGLKVDGMTRTLASQAYDRAVEREDRYGNPQSVWGFNGGLTEIASELPNASERVRIEKASGKIAQIAF